MGVKVFVLGLPGSGKSTATRYISKVVEKKDCTVTRFNDYNVLRKWFEEAPDGPRFSRAENDGFDVHDYTVFDLSLQELERHILEEHQSSSNEIITIEFARRDYLHALQQFSAPFLQDAYFLCVDAEISTCRERTRQRFISPSSDDKSDDHYVSDYIFEAYYNQRIECCIASDINLLCDKTGARYSIDSQKIVMVSNVKTTSKDTFYQKIEQLIQQMLGQKKFVQEKEIPQMHESVLKKVKVVEKPVPNALSIVND